LAHIHIAADAQGPYTITNSFTSNLYDPDTSNNTSTITIQLPVPTADLQVALTQPAGPFVPDTTFELDGQVTSAGPQDVAGSDGGTFTITLATGLSFVDAVCAISGQTATCAGLPWGATQRY